MLNLEAFLILGTLGNLVTLVIRFLSLYPDSEYVNLITV